MLNPDEHTELAGLAKCLTESIMNLDQNAAKEFEDFFDWMEKGVQGWISEGNATRRAAPEADVQ